MTDVRARRVWARVQRIAGSWVSPPETVDDVLDAPEKAGPVAALRAGQRLTPVNQA
ncbi:hypothetical protein [Streptosporangium saharense]|uniref:hypothetical protein n=1 Tax=Streptosporangium saharense TaxID=1706840 RepID=UPI00332F201C